MTSIPPHCQICLEEISNTIAILLPCGHIFDLQCASLLMLGFERSSSRCPLCRGNVEKVWYGERVQLAFETGPGELTPDAPPDEDVRGSGTQDGMAIHIPGQPTPDSSPFIRPDEAVREEMSEKEKERKRTLRRLRVARRYDLDARIDIQMVYEEKDDGKYVISSRATNLITTVTGGECPKIISKLTKEVLLYELSELPPGPLVNHPAVVEHNRMEIKTFVERFSKKAKLEQIEVQEEPVNWINEKGLSCTFHRTLIVNHSNENDNQQMTTRVIETLEERFPTGEVNEAVAHDGRADVILQARKSIRGVWDLITNREDYRNIQKPDRAFTGIFEPSLATENPAVLIRTSRGSYITVPGYIGGT